MTAVREFNFGAGMPDPATFPAQALADAAARVLPHHAMDLSKYPDRMGLPALRQIAADRFERNHGMRVPIENIVLTNGSMQGLMLVAQALAIQRKPLIVEEFTYVGTLNVFRKHQADLVPVPLDDQGMRVDALEEELDRLSAIGRTPTCIYTIASHQNPSGTTLPLDRREKLVELATKHQTVIVEDDCYADVQFTKHAVPAMYKLAEPGRVLYLGSFSKILGPGVRLGYFMAPEPLLSEMLSWKIDGGTSNLSALIVAEYFKEHLWSHIDEANAAVKQKLDTLLAALEHEFAGMDITWTKPDGGLFTWISLPAGTDRARVQALAKERGIVYATGQAFDSLNRDVPYLRLAYGFIANDDIPEGVRLLAECVKLSLPVGAGRR